jgi:hypothetical protein
MKTNKMKMLSRDSLLSLKGGEELDPCFYCVCKDSIGAWYGRYENPLEMLAAIDSYCETGEGSCSSAPSESCHGIS